MACPHTGDPGVSDDETSAEGDKIGTIIFANRTEHAVEAEELAGVREAMTSASSRLTRINEWHHAPRPSYQDARRPAYHLSSKSCAFERDGAAEQIKV